MGALRPMPMMEQPRPMPRGGGGRGAGNVERQLDEWVEAKRAKDFRRADSIRDDLRTKGIEPEEFRPKGGPAVPAMAAPEPWLYGPETGHRSPGPQYGARGS